MPKKKFDINDFLQNQQVLLEQPDIEDLFSKLFENPEDLEGIANDYHEKVTIFDEIAKDHLVKIQRFDHVHFVKYRIKDLYSLLVKIINNSIDYNTKITFENYTKKITDIIGLRILYVFKNDYLPVHHQLMKEYGDLLVEDVKIKLKEGDDESIYKGIKNCVIERNKTYRSIHYIARSEEDNDNCARMEIQTRTIYEEAWSEINHSLLYKKQYPTKRQKQLQDITGYLSSLTGVCDMLSDLMRCIASEQNKSEAIPISENKKTQKQDFGIAEIWKEFIDHS